MNNQAIVLLVTHPPVDWVIFLGVAIILLIDSLRSGTGRAAALSIAAPVTLFLYNLVSHTAILSGIVAGFNTPVLHAALLGGMLVLMVILFHRVMYSFGGSSSSPFQSIIASLSATIILLTLWIQIPFLADVWRFGSVFQNTFGIAYAFWWIILAYLALAFVRS